jgi:ATP-dependent RNA helicase DDX27
VLMSLCSRAFRSGRTIVFFRTKARAHRMKILFGLAGLGAAAELHGDMTQAARLDSLERFRKVWPRCSEGVENCRPASLGC